ncbi:MAG: porin family protein [Mesorhizobium sp.]|nr:porin family protein [Mesorhizobium sp.]
MKQILLGSVAVLCLTGFAQAQEPSYSWASRYLGVQAGYAHSGAHFSGDATSFAGNYSENAFIGGIYAGQDWQTGRFVYGGTVDFDWVDGGDMAFGNVDPMTGGKGEAYSYDIDWVASARARLGYAPTDRLLTYATGGVAVGHFEATAYSFPFAPASYSGVKFGGVIGAGLEYAFKNNWSIKGEYLHYAFDTIDFNLGGTNARFRPSLDVVRVGVAYRF